MKAFLACASLLAVASGCVDLTEDPEEVQVADTEQEVAISGSLPLVLPVDNTWNAGYPTMVEALGYAPKIACTRPSSNRCSVVGSGPGAQVSRRTTPTAPASTSTPM